MADLVGAMRERLVLQENRWPVLAITSLTRSGTAATAVTEAAHGYAVGDYVTVAGATETAYNGKVKLTTVPSTTSFAYSVTGSPSSPATGTPTVVYATDAQGGREANWVTKDKIWAEMLALSASEQLQVAAVQSTNVYSFRIRVRTDLSSLMRVEWTPRWPPRMATQALEITGIVPFEDGTRFLILNCSGAAS
jgi:SPP1 family predicted phage head-tail adaptor